LQEPNSIDFWFLKTWFLEHGSSRKGGASMNAIYELPRTHSRDELTKLIDTIPFLHHQVLRQKLASLNRVLQRIANKHLVSPPVLDRFERQFLDLADRLETNWEEQECWLFVWLRRMVKRGPAISNYLGESLEEAINQAAAANQEGLNALSQVQMHLGDPEWTGKGPLVEEFIDRMHDLEEELAEHEHLEREELFPRIREFCESCMKEEVANAY
jgi:iron-sulfur cluster repair protein YtfE (RIC family)